MSKQHYCLLPGTSTSTLSRIVQDVVLLLRSILHDVVVVVFYLVEEAEIELLAKNRDWIECWSCLFPHLSQLTWPKSSVINSVLLQNLHMNVFFLPCWLLKNLHLFTTRGEVCGQLTNPTRRHSTGWTKKPRHLLTDTVVGLPITPCSISDPSGTHWCVLQSLLCGFWGH